MKKLLSLLICIILITSVLSVLPHTAYAAASGTCGNDLTWILDDDGTLTVSGTGEMSGTYPWLDHSSNIASVIIGDGVTSIGDEAFYRCTALTSIVIPDGVTSIGDRAFSGCVSLTSITIPDSVTEIGWDSFYKCNSLTDVYYSGSEEDWNGIEIDDWGNDALTNATIHYNYTNTTTVSGDMDGDGDITMKDVLSMRRYIAGLDALDDVQIALGDIEDDGDITMKDVLRARRIIAGLD